MLQPAEVCRFSHISSHQQAQNSSVDRLPPRWKERIQFLTTDAENPTAQAMIFEFWEQSLPVRFDVTPPRTRMIDETNDRTPLILATNNYGLSTDRWHTYSVCYNQNIYLPNYVFRFKMQSRDRQGGGCILNPRYWYLTFHSRHDITILWCVCVALLHIFLYLSPLHRSVHRYNTGKALCCRAEGWHAEWMVGSSCGVE